MIRWFVLATATIACVNERVRIGTGANASDANVGSPMQSCSGLAATCGATGTSACCDSPLVPGGTFYRSYDVGSDNAYPDMTNPATVSSFRLDTYEVTVGRFRQFVNAGMGTAANPPAAGEGARMLNGIANQAGWDPTWNTDLVADQAALIAGLKCSAEFESWTDTPGTNENLPATCITWYEATAFCAWDGGFLPTESEWNFAAAGGTEQRAYAWSSPPSSLAIDCSYANYFGCGNAPASALNPVGSESPKGDGKWGQADLTGSIFEWVLDSYETPYTNPCDDCADLTAGAPRSVRGGDFVDDALDDRVAFRNMNEPGNRDYATGVRCARTP